MHRNGQSLKKHQLIAANEEEWLSEVISLSAEKPVILKLGRFKPGREVFLKLLRSATDLHISYKDWLDELWVRKGIQTDKILHNSVLIINAARKFRESAFELMQKLASKYNTA